MGSVLQLAVFFCICGLIRGVATHPDQDEDKKLNKKRSNPNSPGEGDFYFVEEKRNDDTVKSGRAISRSAWSKEDKEPSRPDENKTDTQFTDESSIKKFLSYLLNAVHELKKDIFGMKEMALLKETKELSNPQDVSGNKGKKNEMEDSHNVSKPVGLTENTEFRSKNPTPTSNYITDYYRENGIFTDDEENDDDLANFSDVSDDSSHKPNEGASTHEVSKNIENTHSFKSMKIKRNPDKYSFETKKSTAIPTSLTKLPEKEVQEFHENKESGKCGNCKEYTTKIEQNYSKETRKRTENFKSGKCLKRNNKNPANNLNKKNEPTEKPLKSDEYGTVVSPQNDDSAREESKRSIQDKTPGKNSKNKGGSDFDNKPGFLLQSTAEPSQISRDVNFPTDENENEPKASGAPFEKQQEQIASPKPEDKKQSQNKAKFRRDNEINEHSTVSLQSHKPVLQIPEPKIYTDTTTFDTETNDSHKESKGEGSKVIPTQPNVTYKENQLNSEINRQQTSNSFDIGDTIVPTTSGSKINTDNLNKNPSDNFSNKTGTTENDESEKSSSSHDSETQRYGETKQTKVEQVNDDSKSKESVRNKKLIDSNTGNDNKDKDDNVDSTPANDLPSQDSIHEIQNHGKIGSDEPQETQENEENQTKRTKMQDSPDHEYEYEYEEDAEDFDIWDESDTQDSDQNQESEQKVNNEDNDEINRENTETVLTNESQISQHTGQSMEEKSLEQFDTFLEYFYKHSNNSFFQSLKNQSKSFSDDEDGF